MPSLLPGFEYDIFISYRHNDNRSGWVTEFVGALQEELAATIKDPLTIYFDKNPHDGLLETHSVDKSLEGKLKCLIFIPIISQTYCDPKSYAWQHEFCAFNKMTSRDEGIGRDIKLSNGNVASRILPVKIHDLDGIDKATIESELGGALRAIEFIYKEPGVNRPLKPADSRADNQNKTDYRNQINKVANAVKDLISANQSPGATQQVPHTNTQTKEGKAKAKMIATAGLILFLLVAAGWWYFHDSLVPNANERMSLAVLPFQNMQSVGGDNPYGLGMANEVRTLLTTTKNFEFISSLQATLGYINTPKSPREIGKELGVNYVLTGFYELLGGEIKIQVELVDARTAKVVWSNTVQSPLSDMLKVQAQVAQGILSKFLFQHNVLRVGRSVNPEAVIYAARGYTLYNGFNYAEAIPEFRKAIQLDSSYSFPWLYFLGATGYQWRDTRIKSYLNDYLNAHAYVVNKLNDPWLSKYATGLRYYLIEKDIQKAIELFQDAVSTDPGDLESSFMLEVMYKRNLQFSKALPLVEYCIQQEPINNRHMQEAWILLNYSGNLEDALKIDVKQLQFDFFRNPHGVFDQALLINFVDRLPEMKSEASLPFFLACQQRQWSKVAELGKEMVHTSSSIRIYTYALRELGQNYQEIANGYLSKLDTSSFIDTYKLYELYALLGNVDKAHAYAYYNSGDYFDSFSKAVDLEELAIIHALAGEYVKAAEMIRQLNDEYPQIGNFGIFNHPIYDRAKRESHEFRKALAEVKYPPKLVLSYPPLLE